MSPPSFPKRLFWRVRYMVVAGCFASAVFGGAVDGLAGAVVGAGIGVVLGVFLGVVMGGYAWVLESPLKGAIRGGGLLAATVGLLCLMGVLAKQGWGGLENALPVVLMVAGIGAVMGGLLGAFLAWVAGPIFTEMVQDADRGDSPFKRKPWW
jgi:hypothetical protein